MKICLSGHEEYEWKFGRDMSRDDFLNPYCKCCIRNMARSRRSVSDPSDCEPEFETQFEDEFTVPAAPVREIDPFDEDKLSLWRVAGKVAGNGGPVKFRAAWEIR